MGHTFYIWNGCGVGISRMTEAPVLEARHITRNFGAVMALSDASITLNLHGFWALSGTMARAKARF